MKQGDIVLIVFPFTDLKSIKVRPALVISKEDFNNRQADAVFIMITSAINDIKPEEILIKRNGSGFTQTGLKKESVIRTSKIHSLSQSLAKRKLGSISPVLLKETLNRIQDFLF